MVISLLFVAKVVISVAMVMGLTLIAENVSPRIAGILSGYPLGVAIALFFVGIENGPVFASKSAVYTTAGFCASLALVVAYHWAAMRVVRHQVLLASTSSVVVFLMVAAVLRDIPFVLWSGVGLTGCMIFLCRWRFRHIENVVIEKRVQLTLPVALVRGFAAAAMVLVITGLARIVGEKWTGVFSAFPVTLFPFLVVIHLTYGWAQTQVVIKHFPAGMGSLLVYTATVAMAYPRYGVVTGTLLSFLLATLYLVIFFALPMKARLYLAVLRRIIKDGRFRALP